jgi:hypothetical protein
MNITKKHLSRRTFLKGVGATVSLPLLDSMVPAMAATRNTAAAPVNRLGTIYIPHGAVLQDWIPKDDGTNYTMSPTLKTLEKHREDVLVITNLDNSPAMVRAGEPFAGHSNIMGAWLSGVHAKPTEGADVEAGITYDQIAARHFEKETQLASLELGIEPTDLAGSCDVGFSCAYINTVSWITPTTPLPVENNPRALFERLFGDTDTTDAKARTSRMRKDKSILDSVNDEVNSLRRKLGNNDRSKLTEYLESIRDIERRIQKAEEQGHRDLPVMERPTGAIPPTFADHVKLMMDLQVLAYQTDMTRVCTFMMSKDITNRTYPEVGVRDPHHPLSHHQNNPESLKKLAKINVYHLELLSYYLDRLKATPDGDGSLLDHMMLLYGSGMGDSDKHAPKDLPILLAGGGNGTIKGGRHIRTPEGTPLTNLYLSMLNKLGVPADNIGDSTGEMQELSGV